MSLEGWTTPINPAVNKSRELLKPYVEKRNLIIEPNKNWNNFLFCQKCKMKGIRTKYHKDTMLHVPFEYKRNGKIHKAYTHYCEECGETYVPQSERVGNRND